MAPEDILAVVEDQFFEVRKRLDLQLTRTAELQQQLDAQQKEMTAHRNEIAELHRTVDLAHRLLKQLVSRKR